VEYILQALHPIDYLSDNRERARLDSGPHARFRGPQRGRVPETVSRNVERACGPMPHQHPSGCRRRPPPTLLLIPPLRPLRPSRSRRQLLRRGRSWPLRGCALEPQTLISALSQINVTDALFIAPSNGKFSNGKFPHRTVACSVERSIPPTSTSTDYCVTSHTCGPPKGSKLNLH
jgi:hypothetical protein